LPQEHLSWLLSSVLVLVGGAGQEEAFLDILIDVIAYLLVKIAVDVTVCLKVENGRAATPTVEEVNCLDRSHLKQKKRFLFHETAKVWATSNGKTMVASAKTFTGSAVKRIFPHETASSGRAPLSLPSNSCPVFMYTAKSAPFLMRFALQMWCLMTPPPKMIMPVLGANTASELIALMSLTKSMTSPGFL
jgi:hypothetical protein